MEQKKNRLHYAWFILAGCCILQGATLGLINNCAGVFYSPICKELGFELGKLTMYRMLSTASVLLWHCHLWRQAFGNMMCGS